MSSIYIQEPPTSGKVLLTTSVGDIDIELWSRECPKACRNFIQLCLEGYYNGLIFHRVVKDFIVQGGDPNGDGTGGESIYGEPFKDEFHSRLRFIRRGLVGMANSGKDDNGSQFFFTMGPTPELQNKHTLFGKVTGDTVFNMLKLEEGLTDHNERPLYAQKIIKTEILNNPFPDIVPRTLHKGEDKKDKKKKREKGVKNFGLLSFGEEAEEDELETNDYVQKNTGKAKSLHDVVDDPQLSKKAIKIEISDNESDLEDDRAVRIKVESDDEHDRMERIRSKLTQKTKNDKSEMKVKPKVEIKKEEPNSGSDDDYLVTHDEEKRRKKEQQKEAIRQEIQSIKKEYQKEKKIKEELLEKEPEDTKNKKKKDSLRDADGNELIKSYLGEQEKYTKLKQQLPKKGQNREQFTLQLLSKFRSKLDALKQKHSEGSEADETSTSKVALNSEAIEEDIQGDNWLTHTLNFRDETPILAKDASTKGDDWYDAYDPRNPLNKRKRGDGGGGGGSQSRHNRSQENNYTKRRK